MSSSHVVPARRYAYTLQLMLKKSKRRKAHSQSPVNTMRPEPNIRSPATSGYPQPPHIQHQPPRTDYPPGGPESPHYERPPQPNLPPNLNGPIPAPNPHVHPLDVVQPPHNLPQAHAHPHNSHSYHEDGANLDLIWRGFESATNDQLPMWITDQSLGGHSLSQLGLEAFMMPMELDHGRGTVPQIW